ncbi:hypothetical protein BCR44DRAFT_34952 [Catenaria anguillulae PL171]|uniref:Profilin n=1 Tax=Catenaria anguillulae PL171 TaxID=765915 RepID=A0A1Y2HYI5_9FUNG|nr:hypothetical protein BCR44DRAFT_34952 [Catenaria anguillulae PL171]
MNALLSESLLQTHCFSHAAIIKRKDLVIKARTPDWPIARDELDKVMALFDQPSVAREQGVTLGGCPYRVVRADQTSIYGKVDDEGVNTLRTLGMAPTRILGQKETQLVGIVGGGGGGNLTVNGGGNAAGVKASGQNLGGQGASVQSPSSAGGAGQEQASERSDKDKTVVEVIRPPISSSFASKRYDGIIVCRTGMYVLVGVYDRHPGMAVEAMERLADWFRSKHR